MTSVRMRAVALFLRLARKSGMATAERARKRIRTSGGRSSPPPAALGKRYDVRSRRVGGFECYTVAPRNGRARRGVVYLHGGAYINGIAPQHWRLVSRMAEAGLRVEVPLYGLAPRYTHRDAYPFATAVYRELLADMDASWVAFAGDSAGGGLALGPAQTLQDADLPQPERLVLITPWLDVTLRNPAVPAAEARDPWLGSAGLIEAGRAWAGGDDPADPRLSPINGRLAGLAPVHAYTGTRDLLHPDVLRLEERAAGEGARVRVTACAGAVHVYPLVPAPEGRAAARQIVRELAG